MPPQGFEPKAKLSIECLKQNRKRDTASSKGSVILRPLRLSVIGLRNGLCREFKYDSCAKSILKFTPVNSSEKIN